MIEVSSIAGVRELWNKSKGLPEICVAVVDGIVDVDHPAFQGAQLSRMDSVWQNLSNGKRAAHGTHVASLIFGQPDGPIEGVAPGCFGINIPAFSDVTRRSSQLEIARGIELAIEAGAHVVNISGGQFSPSGDPEDALARALRVCSEENVLVVAAAGNNGCFCNHVPAAVPSVLAVGALGENGMPLPQSNWGATYRGHAILAPGENVLGADLGGGTVSMTGSSMAAPIVSGVAAVLLSMQVAAGRKPDPLEVGALLISTADKCDIGEAGHQPDGNGFCDPFLSGAINIERSTWVMSEILQQWEASETSACGCVTQPDADQPVKSAIDAPEMAAAPEAQPVAIAQGEQVSAVAPSTAANPAAVIQQTGALQMIDGPVLSALPKAHQPIYALGELGYDFGTEARRDTFKQLMAPQEIDGTILPPNPYDARQMVDHLSNNPSEARSLIWTLNLELTPIYALKAGGSFAAEIYGVLTRMLTGAVAAESDLSYIERVAIPGVLSGSSVKLFSGQVVPVVELEQVRGLYGWEVNRLVDAAVHAAEDAAQARGGGGADVETITENLREFLTKIYYDLRNLGTMSRDRALNFAATNAFQAAQTFASALSRGMAVDTINVEKSPFCRLDSDCWDVQLRFFDPENSRRARRIFRFTIDVSDTMPVTLGEVRTWTEAGV